MCPQLLNYITPVKVINHHPVFFLRTSDLLTGGVLWLFVLIDFLLFPPELTKVIWLHGSCCKMAQKPTNQPLTLPRAVQSSRCHHLHTCLLHFEVIGAAAVRIHVSTILGLWRLEVGGVWLQRGHHLTPLIWYRLARGGAGVPRSCRQI